MQHQSESFTPEGSNGVPAGSRLARYLEGSRNTGTSTGSLHTLNANVPSFVPQFAQMNISDNSERSHPASPFIPQRHFGHGESSAESSFVQQENLGGTTYFYGGQSGIIENSPIDTDEGPDPTLLETHTMVNTNGSFAYTGPLPHIGKFRPKGAAGNNIAQFISPDLKIELMHRQLAIEARADPNVYPDLPQSVDHLRDLVPLEPPPPPHAPPQTTMYKAVSVRDGTPYAIRRVHNFRLSQPKQLNPLENWKKLMHVHIVQLREFTQTRDFGDSSLILVYDYHPLADTLKTRHFGGMNGSGFIDSISGAKLGTLPPNAINMGPGVAEHILWSYIIQLSSALRQIHSNGLAARCVSLSKILVQGKTKVLLSGCGTADALTPDNQQVQVHQGEDLAALGNVILSLATGNLLASRRDLYSMSLNYVAQNYSADMKNLITFLFTANPANRKSINEIMPMVGARFYAQLEAAQVKTDYLENELSKELENGRLFRLLCKLNTIVERPEHNMDPSWAETGDRFLLKLFRDYIFHQITENGRPWMDMAHIVHTLNKLDAGISEKIELVSRDGENMLIVSYGDLKRCIEAAFRELQNASASVLARH